MRRPSTFTRRAPRPGVVAAAGALWLASIVGLAAGCRRPPPSPTPAVHQASAEPPYEEFLGDEACRGCHSAEFDDHRGSRHAKTIFAATRQELGRLAPPAGPIAGTGVQVDAEGDGFAVKLAVGSEAAQRLDLALGSGKTGMTYVSLPTRDSLVEIHQSYFPARRQWYVTPGQEREPAGSVGKTFPPFAARQCLLCHVTALPPDTVVPEKRFFGVGCESCHGPGKRHVAAVRAGGSDLQMERATKWSAQQVVDLCGKCHRTAANMGAGAGDSHRFQPYGLMLSRCYRESEGRLSCGNCHDPHRDAETSERVYVAACLKCHSPAAASAAGSGRRVGICPINPKDGCVGCHMPKGEVFATSNVPTRMADHHIRIPLER
jgi:hypothetical protein